MNLSPTYRFQRAFCARQTERFDRIRMSKERVEVLKNRTKSRDQTTFDMVNCFVETQKFFAFSNISWYWDGTGGWNLLRWKKGNMTADDLVLQGARTSAAMV